MMQLPWEIAQYGIAALAVGGLIYVVDRWVNKRGGDGELSAVIKNNTQAMEHMTSVVQAIQLSLVRLEEKTEELLAHSRKQS